MDYDKQKPLTQEEIDYINSKDGLCVLTIPNYSNNNIHVEIAWDLPINITRNEDSFWFNNFKESNKENYWVVYPNNHSDSDFDFEIKQFKDIDKALEYAINSYKKWLKCRIKYVENLKII